MLKNLVRKTATKIGISWLLGQVRAAAEGKLGPEWKARYWALEGKKTITGFALFVASVVLAAIGQTEAATWVGGAAALAVSAGLVDKAWRSQLPEWLLTSQLYQWLATHAEVMTTTFTLAATAVASVDGPEQKTYALILAAFAAVAVQLGLLDSAWKAGPPAVGRITQLVGGIEHVFCDRCGKALVKCEGAHFTGGYYRTDYERYVQMPPGSQFPCNPGEDVVCDACMWADPRYLATWGDPRRVEAINARLQKIDPVAPWPDPPAES